MKKKLLKVEGYIPFALGVIFYGAVLMQGVKINLVQVGLSLLLLLITSIGITSDKKYLKYVGIGTLFVYAIWLSIQGYFDYLQWTSTIIAAMVLVYYLILLFKINNKKDNKENN